MLGKRCLIGAFPWRYEGLEGCPCRIVCFLDTVLRPGFETTG
jgi:kynurenine formamidase